MKIKDISSQLVAWYKAGIDEALNLSIYLTSAPGRGKSTVIENAPKVVGDALGLNLGLVVINGGNLTVMDVMGFGLPKHYDTHSEMVFSEPPFFRTTEGKRLCEYDGGIVYIDEADKASVEVKKIIGEGALSKRFGFHRLPPGWVVWSSGNRLKDRSGSTKELDHLINRRLEVEITDDLESLLDWMEVNGVTPLTIAFTNQNPQIVFSDLPEKQGPWCTPRSLTRMDRFFQLMYPDSLDTAVLDNPTVLEQAAGLIGQGAASQWLAFAKLQSEMPPFEKILADPKGAKMPVKPDAQMLVTYSLAHRVTKENAPKVVDYVKRFPKEFAVTFVQSVVKRTPLLVLEPVFQGWVKENASLIATLSNVQR